MGGGGEQKQQSEKVRKCECLGRAVVSHSVTDVKEFDELWQSAGEVAFLAPLPLLALSFVLFPLEPSQNTSRPYCYHQRVAMTTEARTGEGREVANVASNAKNPSFTHAHA